MQALNKKCTENQTRALIKIAATSTEIRKQKILDQLRRINHNASPVIRGFGIEVNPAFEKVPARQLEPPTIEYKNGTIPVKNGVWMMDESKRFIDAKSGEFAVISFDERTDERIWVKNIKQRAAVLNMGLDDCNSTYRVNTRQFQRPGQLEQKLDSIMNEIKANPKIRVTFCILPFFDTSKIYAKIKQAAELRCGILTQCIKNTTVDRKGGDVSTLVNILLKVNAKLNGTNHKLQQSPLLNSKTMVIGADVTHPSPDQRDIPSVVGVAASHDAHAFKYNIAWRLQESTTEIIQDFGTIIHTQLKYFQNQNGNQLPDKIFYYRDGVSEGQFQFVLGEELDGFRKAFKSIKPDYDPKLTIIVVQKRHHTRFFPDKTKMRTNDRNNNVPAGTVVDQKIVNPNESNFFLCSHASIQGVARPSKYCILMDAGNHTMDQLQTLTYDLCHLFTRCNRSVSYPAPTYYAHLVAYRGRVYIE